MGWLLSHCAILNEIQVGACTAGNNTTATMLTAKSHPIDQRAHSISRVAKYVLAAIKCEIC